MKNHWEQELTTSGWIKPDGQPNHVMKLYHMEQPPKVGAQGYYRVISWIEHWTAEENLKQLEEGLDAFFGAVNYFNEHGKYPDA